MQLNNYSVQIPQGREESSGHVIMSHNTQYAIALKNGNSTRCDAEVEIDGKNQGTWRIDAYKEITIERPGHDDGIFTFYKVGSNQGNQVGLSADEPNIGLVKVTFTPEKIPEVLTRSYGSGQSIDSYSMGSRSSKGLSAGGTGLSGTSEQTFGSARKMDLDYTKSTSIHLRLVANKEDESIRPLTNYSNPIPPAIK